MGDVVWCIELDGIGCIVIATVGVMTLGENLEWLLENSESSVDVTPIPVATTPDVTGPNKDVCKLVWRDSELGVGSLNPVVYTDCASLNSTLVSDEAEAEIV